MSLTKSYRPQIDRQPSAITIGIVAFCAALLVTLLLPQMMGRASRAIHATPFEGAALDNRSGMIVLSDDGRYLVVVNPDSNTLSIVDPATRQLLTEIPVGVDPRSAAITRDGATAYAANQGSDDISVIDVENRQLLATVPVGDRPVNVTLTPDGRYLAVAELGDDTVRFLDTSTLATLSVQTVPDRPHGLSFTPDGRSLLVTHLLSGSVTVLPARPYAQFLPLVGQQGAVFSTAKPLNQSSGAAQSDRQTIATWPNVAPAPAVVINAAGTRAYLPQTMANGLGLNVQFDTTVFPKVSVLNLQTGTHETSEHIPLPETDQPVGLPWDVALTKNDAELWVVNAASNDVSIINLSNPAQPVRTAHIQARDNPRGIAFSPDGQTAYINNVLAGIVSVIDTSTYTVTTEIPVTTIPLPPLLLTGKRLFHSSATPELAQARWVACNTCHVEGEHDGRTWQLQFTGSPSAVAGTPTIRRNTTSLLGMIETYPLRWSAEWDESADSEFSIRFEQFGDGLINGEMHPTLGLPNQGRSLELDSLAAYIDSLAVPQRSHTLTAAELRGKVLFESAQTGCAVCHPPPLYTNLSQYGVGTADGPGEWFGPLIDTPTLRFLYDSAPYLHDGSAATLHDVLTVANPQDEHGVTSHLTEVELADLAAFLRALPHE